MTEAPFPLQRWGPDVIVRVQAFLDLGELTIFKSWGWRYMCAETHQGSWIWWQPELYSSSRWFESRL